MQNVESMRGPYLTMSVELQNLQRIAIVGHLTSTWDSLRWQIGNSVFNVMKIHIFLNLIWLAIELSILLFPNHRGYCPYLSR